MAATEQRTTSRCGRPLLLALALGMIACDGDDGESLAETTTAASAGDETSGSSPEPDALDPEAAEAWQLATFEAEVLPMLSTRCSGCHGRVAAQLGLVLGPAAEVSSAEILRGLVDHEAVAAPLSLVEPGRPEASWLRLKLTGEFDAVACNGGCGGPMPPAGEPVTAAELEALTRWITTMEPTP